MTRGKAEKDGRDQAIHKVVVCDKELKLHPVFAQSALSPFLQILSFKIELKFITSMHLFLTSLGLKQQQLLTSGL